ncbi:sortase [Jatrophihabitans sp.]|uniref:sortase domain-containing protein n=1 Tax=Jatrophihabitans sp. TaxID=1932789 RepID=UPI0030C7406B
MAETPPYQAPTGSKVRRRVLALAAVLVVVAAGATVLAWPRSTAGHPRAVPTYTPLPPSTSAPAPSPTPTPTPTPTKPAVPHDVVKPAGPVSFHFTGPSVNITATVCGMAKVFPLDPPGEQHHTVCWVKEGFGVAPGSHSATTYVLGHAWGQDDHEVLNQLSSRAMVDVLKAKPKYISGIRTYPVTDLNHDTLTLRTKNGTLKYTVADAYAVSKSQAGYVKPLMDTTIANRIVLITCGELDHRDYDYNIIVEAYLTSSIAAKA